MAWRATIKKDVIIAGSLGLGADLFCQCVCEQKSLESVDRRRAASIAIFSASYLGVCCNYIYSLYPALATAVMKSHSFQKMAPHMLEPRLVRGGISTMADNLVHVPILYLPSYFLAVGTMQGSSISASVEDMQASWWPTLGSCWAFWMPFMALNFAAVPQAQQVRAVACANFCWTVTLDYITQKKDLSDDEA